MQPLFQRLQTLARGRISRPARTLISGAVALLSVFGLLAVSTLFMGASSAATNVLVNGNFESGFARQPSCGDVGAGWGCFTNGGAAAYGFYDDQWGPTVAEGSHSQLIEISTKGLSAPDHDRYAGIYRTAAVAKGHEYTLSMKGMIRTTVHDGDPWRYRVQVGWTQNGQTDWAQVTNWRDVGWDTYADRNSPGSFSSYSAKFYTEADHVTLFVRLWKKWGVAEEVVSLNLDVIDLVGPGDTPTATPTATATRTPGYVATPIAEATPIVVVTPAKTSAPVTSCSGDNLVANGGFEHGFASTALGMTPNYWQAFTNGGRANYGFYNDMWQPVVVSGASSLLIEINSKGYDSPDANRYAGIAQSIRGLTVGKSYELTVKGILRGDGGGPDDHRFEAQWGWNRGHNTDWAQVTNWVGVDLGAIAPRTKPGSAGSYTIRFQAPATEITLFLRGWMKWGIAQTEMDLNLDDISLRSCSTTHTPPPPPAQCTYTVKPGDYLGYIAQHLGVDMGTLAHINQISNPNHIYVGQVLHIPGCQAGGHHKPAVHPPHPAPPAPPAPAPHPAYRTHTVSAGEYLGGIAAYYGVNVYTLAQANGIVNLDHIYVGQVLMIP